MINLDNISFIEDAHGKKAVILSLKTFEKIKEQLEELEDINTYIVVKAQAQAQENLPSILVEKLMLSNQSKIKILREYRGYTLTYLAKAVGISESYLSQIENQKRKGNIELYKKISDVLDMDLELLLKSSPT